MIIHGEGGTGKSRVIQSITKKFEELRAKHLLIKAAYTGMAALLIDGKTTHSVGSIAICGNKLSENSKAKLVDFWKSYEYFIIDECSMISKSFLAKLSNNISIAKAGIDSERFTHSFGGTNVILCGDMHQFPPVAGGKQSALYMPTETWDSNEDKVGSMLYKEFSTVVLLTEQMRVKDEVWMDFLRDMQKGTVQDDQISMLKGLVLPSKMNLQEEPWNSAIHVTPRHSVRMKWNSEAVQQHCTKTHWRLYIACAGDTVKGTPVTLTERIALLKRKVAGSGKSKHGELQEEVELAIGMKVMVMENLEMDLDVMNGACGTVVGIMLNLKEPPPDNTPIVRLRYLPSYVLVKLDRTRTSRLQGLQEGVIPITPVYQYYKVQVKNAQGKYITKTIWRLQYAMTGAYSFTDYQSQGQTMPVLIVDIAPPPTGGALNIFNTYVALSRSSG